MQTTFRKSRPALLILCIALAACSSTPPARYQNLDSSSRLRPNTDEASDRIPYRYAEPVDWKKYTSIIIEPVALYQGPDNQFGDMDPSDRQALVHYMQNQFSEKLRARFREVTIPSLDTLRVKLTLTGAKTTTPVIGTFTKFDLAGGPYNIVQSIRGKEGLMNGSVNYAVEISDASTRRLLNAYVAKQYPNALNVGASVGSLSAAKVGIDKGADELADMLK
ncbi:MULTISPECIES: DUF3313 domain-containing protein [Sodalis]|jgi:hypothetical protein|uniref:Uncharacterized protein DUF3313 n=1 Tax=Sodalis ligni TaxID=2697027 RepID=A0A4R1NBD5_9GAMM|nr:DUF3313 domain-containing protein [Sodalis ligni]TCL02931.1 uncharacterized protein DUF3313 [Sodalis ligni]